jgi:hypothetical protein
LAAFGLFKPLNNVVRRSGALLGEKNNKVIYTVQSLKILSTILIIQSALLYSSQDENINYYPLQIGNEWKYESITMEYVNDKLDTISIDTFFTKIVGDTMMPNGLKYFDIQGIDGGFRRIDTLTARVYEYNQTMSSDSMIDLFEYELFDLSMAPHANLCTGHEG